jgi:hypothetical protein
MSTRRTKRPGTIDFPQELISTKIEKVNISGIVDNKLHKKTMIITVFETINTISIYIGNRDIYCMDVQLLKDKETWTVTSGQLTKVRWDSVCSIGEPFGTGTDTILMVKTLVSYINDNYPNVRQLVFNDMSTRICDNGNSVSLAAMKLLTCGKTWYESHFDTTLDTFNDTLYTHIKKSITGKKHELSFDKFSMYSNIQYLEIPNGVLRELYDNSKTWQEFFSEILNTIGISKLCIWFSKNNWLDIFLHTILNINISSIQFILNIKKYDEIQYKVIKNNGGSYRLTKKNTHK